MDDKHFLAITASGEDTVGLVEKLTERITQSGGNIEQSRMGVLGGQFSLIMLLSGEEFSLRVLESQLGALGEELGLTIVHKWTQAREHSQPIIPYRVEVVAMDHPGIVHGLASFFARQHINIEELETDVYAAPHTGTHMFSVNMTVGVPSGVMISPLREAFLAYCDDLNLDASLEPARA
ncbi:MAG: ACT domain-containing protein [Sulfuricellaceae bacterium]|nr:ACT domain-containing protein [Sulfuricellaceae bacterium]